MLKGFHYTRQPTLEVLIGAVIFAAALLTATFVITERYDGDGTSTSDTPGVWSAQNSGTDTNLNAVDFVDAQNGWAVGGNGTVLRTSDAGQTWEAQNTGTRLELTSVDFHDINEGWVVGKLGLIIHTSDGGQTWDTQAGPEITLGINLASVIFTDFQTGLILAERGSGILRTVDGGATWTREFLSNTSARSDVFFLNANRGWIPFSGGGVFHTFDGGETWELTPGANGTVVGQQGIFFVDENNGWIAGSRGRNSDVSGGLQFNQFLTDGMVARTTDGGQTWQRHDVRTGRFLWDLAFLDTRRGWAVGSFGSIIYTDDGGMNWESQATGADQILRSVAFIDPNNGWTVGDGGTILKFTGR
ncbi:MAG: YCF48-related protein [SAR202 cluster bacterium]|nr:YCF48-related protein [SAR202 cluster bacterium]MDP6513395.1 YCF48-related protein [SAR202 cluster bacterium]MDP6713050.1 YCF48-related protein [SAR202 cluster bacterium]